MIYTDDEILNGNNLFNLVPFVCLTK